MKIYTKRGDGGETSLIGCKLPKNDERVALCGDLDELNASIGMVISYLECIEPHVRCLTCDLKQLQEELMILSTIVASKGKVLPEGLKTLQGRIGYMEEDIDMIWDALPRLNNFVFPRGTRESVHAHMARAICRRAERSASGILLSKLDDEEEKSLYMSTTVQYLNRLSDYLFCIARLLNEQEELWITQEEEMEL